MQLTRERAIEGVAFVALLPITVPIWIGMTVSTVCTATATAAFFDQLDRMTPPPADPVVNRRVLRARGVVAGRPYVLTVGVHALAVRFPTTASLGRHPVVIAHHPIRSVGQAEGVIAVARELRR